MLVEVLSEIKSDLVRWHELPLAALERINLIKAEGIISSLDVPSFNLLKGDLNQMGKHLLNLLEGKKAQMAE